jgi:hypothetical protein
MQYVGIRSEGGLIPYDILDSIANEEAGLGQQAKDFGLAAGRRLTDEIARAWSDAQDYWHIFQRRGASLPESETGATLTRKWVTDLLGELLGYDLTYQPSGAVILGKNCPISHRAGAGEESPPVHVEGLRIDLDRRPLGRRLSPQALVQEYLNNSEGHLWGIVTNGVLLRLLRDTSRTSRPTYLEFDLQSILEGNRFNEFALFYRVCHRSRLPKTAEDSTSCWLEKYFQLSIEQGGRVRDKLRVGVEDALKTLGTGLLRHPNNTALRERVKSGALSPAEFHRQLLRLVYRLLFLMVAEERRMIVPEAPDSERRQRLYDTYYGVGRLRNLAEKYIEPSTFGDLWIGLQQTFALFEDGADSNPLGVPPLNGALFSDTALPDIRMRFDHKGDALGPFLYNADLLKAMYRLSLFEEKRVLQRVNYRDLDVEELGSVYESLLDYQPVFTNEAEGTRFDLLAGSERKSTGSYYTRPELVRELIESALVPVLRDRLNAARDADPEKQKEKQQQAILSMSVCDPACGSGHFLLAAARRLGRELAKVRTGEDEPTPREFHLAVREVITHCIYGVDLNPLAVDLCKLALWLEGHWTGKPLSFLDHRIKCGNSLIGVLDPKVLEEGIPDDAFKPVTGDVKAAASAYKQENKEARKRLERSRDQGRLRFDAGEHLRALAIEVQEISSLAEDAPADVREKEQRYAALRDSGDFNQELLASHLWTAAFFAELQHAGDKRVPTTEELERCLQKLPVNGNTLGYAFDLAREGRFFHWKLEFPEVFEKGGFDVVLGNPPWDKIKLEDKQFWVGDEYIANAPNTAERNRRIAKYREGTARQRTRVAEYEKALHRHDCLSKFVRGSGRFELTAVGDVNTYALFAELNCSLLNKAARAGILLPTGIATDDSCKAFFSSVTERRALASLFDFENREGIFPAIDSRMKFSALTLSGKPVAEAQFAFFLTRVEHLQDKLRRFTLSADDLALLNPNTRTCPVFRTQYDALLTRKIYQHAPILVNESTGENPWGVKFLRMFDMSNDSASFTTEPRENHLPLYEAKLFHQFDHRWATYEDGEARDVSLAEKQDPNFRVTPRYWVPAEEVRLRASDVPPALVQAVRSESEEMAQSVLLPWWAGYAASCGRKEDAERLIQQSV